MTFPRRGEIYLVAFDPTVGYEIQKTRPAVIIQNDVSNEYSPITIVAAISAQFRTPPHPREVPIAAGGKTGLRKTVRGHLESATIHRSRAASKTPRES